MLSREDELCTMQTMDRYNHPDGDIMSLLQAIDLVEGILKTHHVVAQESAGFKPRTVMQIWQNIAQISETMGDSGLPTGSSIQGGPVQCSLGSGNGQRIEEGRGEALWLF